MNMPVLLWLALYIGLSFVQALFFARSINKMQPLAYPKTTVLLYTFAGIAATATFLVGVLAGFVERVVRSK